MQLSLNEDQRILRDTFGRFFAEHSSMAQVRAAEPLGFDKSLWSALADMGVLAMRVPGDGGFSLFDTALVMSTAGAQLASGPIIEAVLAARVLALLAPDHEFTRKARTGEAIIVLAPAESVPGMPQIVPGGAVADAILFLAKEGVYLLQRAEPVASPSNHATQPLGWISLADEPPALPLAQGARARQVFLQAVEEWKVLTAAMLNGLARRAVELAADYAKDRAQFGRPIGSYQAIAHPLADRITDIEGAQMLVWSALWKSAIGAADACAEISMAFWWSAKASGDAVQRALHTFGGYGLTNEYDIQLYHRRAKGLALVCGDPADELLRAGAQAWLGSTSPAPDRESITIDLSFGAEAQAFAAETRAFFEKHLTSEWRAKAHYSYDGHDWDLYEAMGRQRLLFPTWTEEYGGRGAAGYAAAAGMEVWDEFEVTTHAVAVSNMVGHVIARFGSAELREKYLPALAAGKAISCLGYTEPSCGSDVFAARTRAVRDGEDWIIDGQKMFTSGANLASHVLLLARTDPEAPKHKGITLFVVPMDSPGVAIHPVFTYQDERTNATFYSNVRIPDSHRVGSVNGGAEVLGWALILEQGGGGFCGHHRHLVNAAVEWAKESHRGGQPPIRDPRVLERLARAHVHARVSTLTYYRSLWLQHMQTGDRAAGPMSKLFASEAFLGDAADLMDLAAPETLLRGKQCAGIIELGSRHASVTTIYAGTSEVHRSQIAEKALGLPRSR